MRVVALFLVMTMFAGCLGDEEAEPLAAEPVADVAQETVGPVAIKFSSHVGPVACVGVEDTCFGPHLEVLTGGERFYEVNPSNRSIAWDLNATLTWNPASALTEEMQVVLFVMRSDDSLIGRSVVESIWWQGSSPLQVNAEGLKVASDQFLELSVRPPNHAPAPVRADVGTEQPFDLEGQLLPVLDATG